MSDTEMHVGSAVTRLIFARPSGALELIAVPPCPHEGCGWFMPELSCPAHGNYGMTFLFVRRGPVTWVKAALGIPREPLPDEANSGAAAAMDQAAAVVRNYGDRHG